MTFLQVLGTLEISLIYMFVGLGVLLTFKVLNFSDLSVDGTFTLGAALSAWVTFHYDAPFLSLVISFLGGMGMGSLTALLHLRFAITPLMAGIIVMTGLYSLNMRIMGGPNISILGRESLFSTVEKLIPFPLGVKLAGVGLLLLGVFIFLESFY